MGGGVGLGYEGSTWFVGSGLAFATRSDAASLGSARTLLFYGTPEVGARWQSGNLAADLALGLAQINGQATAPQAIAGSLAGV